jgi:hypothetical protein
MPIGEKAGHLAMQALPDTHDGLTGGLSKKPRVLSQMSGHMPEHRTKEGSDHPQDE